MPLEPAPACGQTRPTGCLLYGPPDRPEEVHEEDPEGQEMVRGDELGVVFKGLGTFLGHGWRTPWKGQRKAATRSAGEALSPKVSLR